jgi:hypothetical protein
MNFEILTGGSRICSCVHQGPAWWFKIDFSDLISSIKKIKIIFPLMQRMHMLVYTAVSMYNPLW